MNISLEEFRNNLSISKERLKAYFKQFDIENECYYMEDGVINAEQYYNSSPRILWILKEPYDEDGGNYSIADTMNLSAEELIERSIHKSRTWSTIIYSSFCVHNQSSKWNDISNIKDDHSLVNSLKKIAMINVLKHPGETSTPAEKLSKGYQQHKDVLKEQIATYNPDIIIGGGTLHLFQETLGFTYDGLNHNYEFPFLLSEKLFIDAGHPAQRKTSQETYVDGITEIVQLWKDKQLN